jgi:hypothetical protein
VIQLLDEEAGDADTADVFTEVSRRLARVAKACQDRMRSQSSFNSQPELDGKGAICTIGASAGWKKGFKKLFHEDTNSSGSWRLEGGVLVANFTTSTDPDRRYQVLSARIVSVSPTEAIYVGDNGLPRKEWRVR